MSLKKQIYFIRHGESELNALNIRQGREGHLSAIGREQAKFAADRFKKIPIEIVIASEFTRAQETAGIIAETIKAPLQLTPLLNERRNPHEIIGRPSDEPEVAAILNRMDRSFHSNEQRISDEENFQDLKDRARALLRFLETRPENKILCVTHYIFLQCVAGYIELGEEFSANHLAKFNFLNPLGNAAITYCTYEEHKKRWPWQREVEPQANFGWTLVVWNDYGRIK